MDGTNENSGNSDNKPVSGRMVDVGFDAFTLFGLQNVPPDSEGARRVRQRLEEIYAQIEEERDGGR